MGRPTIRNFPNNSFCSGPQVQANDASIMAELQGNCAKGINIRSFKSIYPIIASVRWYWLETSIGPVWDENGITKQTSSAFRSGVVWQYRCERPSKLMRYFMQFTDVFETGPGLEVHIGLYKSKDAPKFESSDAPTNLDDIGEKISGTTFQFTTTSDSPVQDSAQVPLFEAGSPSTPIGRGEHIFVAAQVTWPDSVTGEKEAFGQFAMASRQRLHVQLELQEEHL